ncbi:hypothetical protein [Sorangium sp. So ce887]|uniref:hypothetical protein n=1 Tax=Sorangium sp. So ce887 TaxID=3133324 RepID=UPI003F646AE7
MTAVVVIRSADRVAIHEAGLRQIASERLLGARRSTNRRCAMASVKSLLRLRFSRSAIQAPPSPPKDTGPPAEVATAGYIAAINNPTQNYRDRVA